MALKLEKFYSSFGGTDTRSNRLLMDPKTFRNGSKNFRYNFQDEIQNANGFQHKGPGSNNFVDIFEYKFRDVNTGESKSQVLGVATDGNLYRNVPHFLKWTTTVGSSYSFFYNEVADAFQLTVSASTITVSETMTMAQLKTALNAVPGIVVDIVDSDGSPVVSTNLAYLMDCRINDAFELNGSWAWEIVPHPNIQSTSGTNGTFSTYTVVQVPFITTLKAQSPATYPEIAASYEGISSVNLNNCIYMTDGGFPLKYDGKTVYRAGMPKQIQGGALPAYSKTGVLTQAISTPSGLTSIAAGTYRYKFRFGFRDYNGGTYFGTFEERPQFLSDIPVASGNVMQITTKGIVFGQDFPTFCAKVNGDQGPPSGGASMVLTVFSGHNILPGMVVRQVTTNGPLGALTKNTSKSFINFYAKVTAVTNTTITLAATVNTDGTLAWASRFDNNQIVSAYFVETFLENKRPEDKWTVPPGAFLEVYRTKVNATLGPYYLAYRMPVPHNPADTAVILDNIADSDLTLNLDDQLAGGDIPRACKYVAKWQSILVTSGRPADTELINEEYPSVSDPQNILQYAQTSFDLDQFYTEAYTCDNQSIYWSSLIAPEGFPQDGLNEFLIETLASDRVKGMAENKDAFFVMKERSTGLLTGDLGTNSIALEVLEDDVGLASHKTLQDVRGSLVWLDANKGFYACVAGRLPEHIGYPICDYQQNNFTNLDYSQAAAMNARAIDMYICVVGSTWFVFDYSETKSGNRNCWYIWERFNANSVCFTSENEILLQAGSRLWKMKVTDTRFDMTDHKSAIEMDARTAWINFGNPTIDKRWERFWVNSIQGGFTLTLDQYGNYLDPLIGSNNITFKEGTKLTVKEWIKAKIDKLSSISVGFRNAEKNKLVRIQGFEIEYAPDYDVNEPKR